MGSSQTSVSALPNVTVVPSSEYINRTGGVHISGSILENPNSNNAASESSIGELNSRQHIYLENSKNYIHDINKQLALISPVHRQLCSTESSILTQCLNLTHNNPHQCIRLMENFSECANNSVIPQKDS